MRAMLLQLVLTVLFVMQPGISVAEFGVEAVVWIGEALQRQQQDRPLFEGRTGLLILEVASESIAAKADVSSGDILLEYAGHSLSSSEQFTDVVRQQVPNTSVAISVLGKYGRREVSVASGTFGVKVVPITEQNAINLYLSVYLSAIQANNEADITQLMTDTPSVFSQAFSYVQVQAAAGTGDSSDYQQIEQLMRLLLRHAGERHKHVERLFVQGEAEREQGDLQAASKYWEQGLEASQKWHMLTMQERFLSNLGSLRLSMGETRVAIDLYVQAIAMNHALSDRDSEAFNRNNLGLTYHRLAQYEDAVKQYQQVALLYQGLGNQTAATRALLSQAVIYRDQGNYPRARALLKLAHTQYLAANDQFGLAMVASEVGVVDYLQGSYTQALENFESALASFSSTPSVRGGPEHAAVLAHLGMLRSSQGRYLQAEDYYRDSLDLYQQQGNAVEVASLLASLAGIHLARGAYPTALQGYHQALKLHREFSDPLREANALSNLGLVYSHFGDYSQAEQMLRQAEVMYGNFDHRKGQVNILNNLATIYSEQGNYEQAFAVIKQAEQLFHELGDKLGVATVHMNQGLFHDERGNFKSAQAYYKEAITQFESLGHAAGTLGFHLNMGSLYEKRSQYDLALSALDKAEAVARQLDSPSGLASAMSNKAMIAIRRGNFDRGVSLSEQALENFRQSGERSKEANTLLNIGVAYSEQGRYQTSLQYYQSALGLYEAISDPIGQANANNNNGKLWMDLGDYRRAQEHYALAFTIAEKINAKSLLLEIMANRGILAAFRGNRDQALQHHQQALDLAKSLDNRLLQARVLNTLANTLHESGNDTDIALAKHHYLDATQLYKQLGIVQEAAKVQLNLAILQLNGGELDAAHDGFSQSAQTFEQFALTDALWFAQAGLAAVAEKRGELDQAVEYFQLALDTIEQVRTPLGDTEHRRYFARGRAFVFDMYIDLLGRSALSYTEGVKRHQAADKALQVFEMRQARTLLEEIAAGGVRRFAHVPQQARAQLLAFDQEIADLDKKIAQERVLSVAQREDAQRKSWQERRRQLLEQSAELNAELSKLHPDYQALQSIKPADLAQVQASLSPGQGMLVYLVLDDSSLLWFISEDGLQLFRLEGTGEKALLEKVAQLREPIEQITKAVKKSKPRQAIAKALTTQEKVIANGQQLFQQLFPKAVQTQLQTLDTLYVVPTGPLYALPFEQLVSSPDSDRYLLEDVQINYLSSAGMLPLLRFMQQSTLSDEDNRAPFLAFANPDYGQAFVKPLKCAEQTLDQQENIKKLAGDKSDRLYAQSHLRVMSELRGGSAFSPLSDTEIEACEIARLFGVAQDRQALHLRQAASKEALSQLNAQNHLANYRNVLFAMHGLLPDRVDSELNQPALAMSRPDENGLLTMSEIFNLKLNADLVVLSACSSGLGESVRGEGIMGMTRAFMYAGSRNVVASLWEVDSRTSTKLTIELFRHIQEKDASPTAALRQAKLALLSEGRTNPNKRVWAHPYFWAPFVLFGSG